MKSRTYDLPNRDGPQRIGFVFQGQYQVWELPITTEDEELARKLERRGLVQIQTRRRTAPEPVSAEGGTEAKIVFGPASAGESETGEVATIYSGKLTFNLGGDSNGDSNE